MFPLNAHTIAWPFRAPAQGGAAPRSALWTIRAGVVLACVLTGAAAVKLICSVGQVVQLNDLAAHMTVSARDDAVWQLNARAIKRTAHPLFILRSDITEAYQSGSPWERCSLVGQHKHPWYVPAPKPLVMCSTLPLTDFRAVAQKLSHLPVQVLHAHMRASGKAALSFWP